MMPLRRPLAALLLLALALPSLAVEPLGVLLGRAREARDAGEWESALRDYQAMLDQVPTHETALRERAQTLSWAGRYAEALALYRQFREAFPVQALDTDLRIAQVQAWSGDEVAALATLAPWVAEGHGPAVRADATYRAWDGDTGGGIARLDAWLADHADDQEARLLRARFRSWTGDTAAAEADYLAVLAQDADNVEAQLGLARMALWRGDGGGARQRLDACDAGCRDSAEGRVLAAQLDAADGRVRAAVAAWRRLAEGGAAQRDARELLFEDVSARGPWVELRQQRTDTNEGLRTERPTLRVRLPWRDGSVQLEAARRNALFRGTEADAGVLGLSLRQPLGGRWRMSAGLQRDDDFGGAAASAWSLGTGARLAPGWQWSAKLSRQLLDFTPAAIARRGALRGLDSSLEWTPGNGRSSVSLGLGRAWLSAGSERESFYLAARQRLPLAALDWRVGAVARGFGYSETRDLGFFNPERYRFLGLTSGMAWRRARQYELRLDLQAGQQRVNDDASQFTWAYTLGGERLLPGQRWALFAEWSGSRAGLPVAAAGDPADYRENSLTLGLRWRGEP